MPRCNCTIRIILATKSAIPSAARAKNQNENNYVVGVVNIYTQAKSNNVNKNRKFSSQICKSLELSSSSHLLRHNVPFSGHLPDAELPANEAAERHNYFLWPR